MTAAWRTSNSTSLMKHTQVIVSGRGLQMLFILGNSSPEIWIIQFIRLVEYVMAR
jgi:hypothetical protein